MTLNPSTKKEKKQMPLQGVQPKKDCVHFAQNRVKSKTQEHLQKRSVSYAIKEEVCHHCFSQIRVFFLQVEEDRQFLTKFETWIG